MNKRFFYKAFFVYIAMASSSKTITGDIFHFYRTPSFLGEPRFEKKGLSSVDITLSRGSTKTGHTANGNKTNLLNLYGPVNIQALGLGLPYNDLTDPLDSALSTLALTPCRDHFGHLAFDGKFSIIETNMWFTQNIKRGFFFQAHVPIRSLAIKNISYTDLSPTDTIFPNNETASWQNFLTLLPAILEKHTLYMGPTTHKGIGDTTFFIGWTYNYQENPILDFIDTTVKIGILAPTGAVKNERDVFGLPLGYNGHTGFPLQCNAALGIYEWITIGGHCGALFFDQHDTRLHIKTHNSQSSFIKLAQENVCIHKGTIWHVGGYIKADHFFRGLSFLGGYTFAQENSSWITPNNHTFFDTSIMNSDTSLKGWNMGTLHFLLDYDFAQEHIPFGPKIGIFYDHYLRGKNSFNTSMSSGMVGFDIAWQF